MIVHRTNADNVTVDVKPEVVVSSVKNVKLADIKPGTFIGTAATPDANVPVVTFAPATHADLVAGKKVFVVATPVKAGEYAATRVVVEKDGIAPPM